MARIFRMICEGKHYSIDRRFAAPSCRTKKSKTILGDGCHWEGQGRGPGQQNQTWLLAIFKIEADATSVAASLLFKRKSDCRHGRIARSDRHVTAVVVTLSNVTLFHCVNCGLSHALSVVF